MTFGYVALFIIVGLLLMGLTSMTASLIIAKDKTPAYIPPPRKKPKGVITVEDNFLDDDFDIDDDVLE